MGKQLEEEVYSVGREALLVCACRPTQSEGTASKNSLGWARPGGVGPRLAELLGVERYM